MGATVAQRMLADRERFPAMLPDEILVFKAWLRLHEKEYDSFDFNVRIGKGEDAGPTFSDTVREAWRKNTQLRVDAVAFAGGVPTLIEVKREAGPASVGQLLTYRAVWMLEQRSAVPPILLLVASSFTPNVLPAIRETGIRLDIVDVDFSPLKVKGVFATGPTTGRARA